MLNKIGELITPLLNTITYEKCGEIELSIEQSHVDVLWSMCTVLYPLSASPGIPIKLM